MNFHELITQLKKLNTQKNNDLQTALILPKIATTQSPLDPSTYQMIKKFLAVTK